MEGRQARKLREDKMQEEGALRTVNCLRGRLLAERAASRAVNEKAEIMSNKVKELEEQLQIETKYRRKAEKKLSILKKKVQSLNVTFCTTKAKELDKCKSLDHSETSCISSTGSATEPETENAEQAKKKNSEIYADHEVQDNKSNHGLKPSAMKVETRTGENCDNEANQNADDSVALVPVNLPMESKSSSHEEMKIDSESVREVLCSLEQIQKNIQATLERRRSFKAG